MENNTITKITSFNEAIAFIQKAFATFNHHQQPIALTGVDFVSVRTKLPFIEVINAEKPMLPREIVAIEQRVITQVNPRFVLCYSSNNVHKPTRLRPLFTGRFIRSRIEWLCVAN